MKKNIFLLVLILVSAILISECNSQDYTQNNPGGEQLSNNQSDQPEPLQKITIIQLQMWKIFS